MKIISRHYKKMKIAYIKVAVLAIIAAAFCLPYMQRLESTGDNIFTVYLNGMQVGVIGDIEEADNYLIAARKRLAGSSDEMVLAESELSYEGDEVLWGEIDDDSVIISNMVTALRGSVKETLNRSYTVKINEYTVNLASTQEVLAFDADAETTMNRDAMVEAIGGVRAGQVTYAVRNTTIDGMEIHEGDIMGLGDHGLLCVGSSISGTAIDTLKSMVDEESELVSIYYGLEVKPEDAGEVLASARKLCPSCEIELHDGGQPIYYYIISVE